MRSPFVLFLSLIAGCTQPVPLAVNPTESTAEPTASESTVSEPAASKVSVVDEVPGFTSDPMTMFSMEYFANGPVATVNKQPVEAYRFNLIVINRATGVSRGKNKEIKTADEIIQKLIEDELLHQVARDMSVPEENVDIFARATLGLIPNFGEPRSVEEEADIEKKRLHDMHITPRQFRSEIRNEMAVGLFLQKKYQQIDEKELAALYEKEGATSFVKRPRLQIQKVAFEFEEERDFRDTMRAARKFVRQSRESKSSFRDFAKKQFPNDIRVADTFFEKRDRYPDVHALRPGEISEPFRDGKRVLVVKVITNDPGGQLSRAEAYERLALKRFDHAPAREKELAEQRATADIQIHKDAIVFRDPVRELETTE